MIEQKKLQPEYRLHRRLNKLMREAISDFSMIEEGDRILIGLSGGKDSLALLDLLGEHMKKSNHFFSLEAIHVKMRRIDYLTDVDYLTEKSAQWGIPFHLQELDLEPDRNSKRTPCFLCSWNRRKILFEMAQKLGCNKIALGHHQDDILRTALMNLTFNGSFSTMPAKISMRKFELTIIRPLAKISESELKEWAKIQGYLPLKKMCPFETVSNRTNIDQVLLAMEHLNKDSRYHLWHALAKSGALVE